MVIVDSGHAHLACITPGNVQDKQKEIYASIGARHEPCNFRLKICKTLTEEFKHSVKPHKIDFHTVSKFTFSMVCYEGPLFELYSERFDVCELSNFTNFEKIHASV